MDGRRAGWVFTRVCAVRFDGDGDYAVADEHGWWLPLDAAALHDTIPQLGDMLSLYVADVTRMTFGQTIQAAALGERLLWDKRGTQS